MMQSLTITVEEMDEVHIGENIAARLHSIATEWAIGEKVEFVEHGNAANKGPSV